MNQLEHLRALRDKARVQTEQAKAVLKQQGEITESLDRLIAALEGKEDFDFSSRRESLSIAKGAAMAAVAGDMVSGNGREREGGPLVQMIANLDKKNGESAPLKAPNQNEIVWLDEVVPVLPPIKKVGENRALPKLEPIVWEVANVQGYPPSNGSLEVETPKVEEVVNKEASTEDLVKEGAIVDEMAMAEAPAPVCSVIAPALVGLVGVGAAVSNSIKSNEGMGVKFKFLKFGEQPEETPMEVPVNPQVEVLVEKGNELIAPSIVSPVGVRGGSILSDSEVPVPPVAAIKNDFSFVVIPDQVPVVELTPKSVVDFGLPPMVAETKFETDLQSDDTVPLSPSLILKTASNGLSVKFNESAEEVISPVVKEMVKPSIATSRAVSSNIFFDANSAYLKESELTKLQAIAAAISGSEARIVKIQGLEDLASSNDFKVLLASRRVLAVKKKLAEKGVGINQISINEIRLSDDGRVLDPASISIIPV